MATIEKRRNKNGEVNAYRITVAGGFDSSGKQIRHRMTWKPEPKMTPRQTEKALARAVADFERQIEQGYQVDDRQTFSEYANYVIDLKERTGVKPRTIDIYRVLMKRIDFAIGHLKLGDIRPQHLNAFYKNLAEEGVRQNGDKSSVRIDLNAWLKLNGMSRAQLSRLSKVSDSTIASAANGNKVQTIKAKAIAEAMEMDLEDVFTVEHDVTPLSAKTILEYHRLISTIFAQAEKEMLVPFNPASKATPPRQQKKTAVYYQPEEMDAILDALENAPLKWKALTYLLIDTGCRRGEAVGLKWSNLDMQEGIMTINCAILYSPNRGIYEGTTKTGKSRMVHLSPETLGLLREHKTAQTELRIANGDRWNDTDYVFTQDNGLPMNPDSITCWLKAFSSRKGLPHIHPHAFRHTAASTMIADGIDLVTAANELGHSNATTTATIYAHQISEAKAKASESRSGIFRRRQNRLEKITP